MLVVHRLVVDGSSVRAAADLLKSQVTQAVVGVDMKQVMLVAGVALYPDKPVERVILILKRLVYCGISLAFYKF